MRQGLSWGLLSTIAAGRRKWQNTPTPALFAAALTFNMSGRQRHIRKTRMLSFDEDEGGEEEALGAAQPPAAVKAAHAQRKAAAGGKPSLLSFGDDMGRDGCAPDARKKTSTTGTRTRPSLRVAPPPSAGADREGPTAFSSGAGEYTVEKLSELRKNARSFPGASDGSAGGKAAPAAAGGFKLAGSFKAAAPPKDDRFQYDVRAAGVVKPTPLTAPLLAQPPLPPPSEPTPPPPPPPGGPALPPPGQQQQQQLEDEEDLDIPDEEMIK